MRRGRRQQSGTASRASTRPKRRRSTRPEPEDSALAAVFPAFVTLLSVLCGLYLYVHSTRPALREQSEIEQMEQDLVQKAIQGRVELRRRARLGEGVETDPEALVHEFDRRGISIDEADRLAAELVRARAEKLERAKTRSKKAR